MLGAGEIERRQGVHRFSEGSWADDDDPDAGAFPDPSAAPSRPALDGGSLGEGRIRTVALVATRRHPPKEHTA